MADPRRARRGARSDPAGADAGLRWRRIPRLDSHRAGGGRWARRRTGRRVGLLGLPPPDAGRRIARGRRAAAVVGPRDRSAVGAAIAVARPGRLASGARPDRAAHASCGAATGFHGAREPAGHRRRHVAGAVAPGRASLCPQRQFHGVAPRHQRPRDASAAAPAGRAAARHPQLLARLCRRRRHGAHAGRAWRRYAAHAARLARDHRPRHRER